MKDVSITDRDLRSFLVYAGRELRLARDGPGDRLMDAAAIRDRHTCRNEGYNPDTKPCQGCMAQLSRNGATASARVRRRERGA